MKFWCKDTDMGNRGILRETCPSATLSTTNSTLAGKGLKQDLCGEMPVTESPNHGMAPSKLHHDCIGRLHSANVRYFSV
jgi:hypothetical protein